MPSPLMNCPQCGKRVSSESKFCPDCGFDLEEYMHGSKQPKRVPKAVILIVAVCVFFAVFFSNSYVRSFLAGFRDGFSQGRSASADNSSTFSSASYDDYAETIDDSPLASDEFSNIASSDASSDLVSRLVGVYMGDDHNMLVLRTNGKANYYCSMIEYTDLNCDWKVKDDKAYIILDKLHCTVVADVPKEGDIDRLTFTSDSLNWTDEEFKITDVDPEEYIKRDVSTYNENLKVQADGTFSYTIKNIGFTVSKHYIDFEAADSVTAGNNACILQSVSLDNDYIGALLFYNDTDSYSSFSFNENIAKSAAESFASRFNDNYAVSNLRSATIAGLPAYICDMTGNFNDTFYSFTGYDMDGYIAVIYNKENKGNVVVMLEQCRARSIDGKEEFMNMLENAAVVN